MKGSELHSKSNWVACAEKIAVLVKDFEKCDIIFKIIESETLANPLIFLIVSLYIVTLITNKSTEYIKYAKKVLAKLI